MLPVAAEGWAFILRPARGRARVSGAWLGWPTAGAAVRGGGAGLRRRSSGTPSGRARPCAGGVLAPADGRVMVGRGRRVDPFVGPAVRVSIFLSPLDVHVNRAPDRRRGGRHGVHAGPLRWPPTGPRRRSRTSAARCASQGDARPRRRCVQIAGVLARRIVCRVRPGDKLAAGRALRPDPLRLADRLLVPRGTEVRVRVGDRVRGGETVMGVLR